MATALGEDSNALDKDWALIFTDRDEKEMVSTILNSWVMLPAAFNGWIRYSMLSLSTKTTGYPKPFL